MEKEHIKTGTEIKNLLDVKHDFKHYYKVSFVNRKMFNGLEEGDIISLLMEPPINSILTMSVEGRNGVMIQSLDFNDLIINKDIILEYVGPKEKKS